MTKLSVSTFFDFESGYNTLVECILEELPKYNCLIKPRSFSNDAGRFEKYFENLPVFKEDLDLLVLPPCNELNFSNFIFFLNPRKDRVMLTMWESTRINEIFIEQMNNMKAIIVPNKWNKANFEAQGCEVPIHVVNLFVDTEIFNYQPPVAKDHFVFGTANKDPRKRLGDVVSCFNKAFSDKKDVKLKIKISPKESYDKIFTGSKIEICKDSFTRNQLKDWYSDNDCFVSCVSAEGWGLMQHESMACGRPVIAAKYAGLSEFMTEENSFCVNYKEVPAEGYWKAPASKWSKYDEEHLIETMRFAYNNPSTVVEKGRLASVDACKLDKRLFVTTLLDVISKYK